MWLWAHNVTMLVSGESSTFPMDLWGKKKLEIQCFAYTNLNLFLPLHLCFSLTVWPVVVQPPEGLNNCLVPGFCTQGLVGDEAGVGKRRVLSVCERVRLSCPLYLTSIMGSQTSHSQCKNHYTDKEEKAEKVNTIWPTVYLAAFPEFSAIACHPLWTHNAIIDDCYWQTVMLFKTCFHNHVSVTFHRCLRQYSPSTMWTQGLLLSVLPQGRALSLGMRGPAPWVVWPGWRLLCSMTGLVVILCLNVHFGCLLFPRDPGWDGGQGGSSQYVLGTVCVCVCVAGGSIS